MAKKQHYNLGRDSHTRILSWRCGDAEMEHERVGSLLSSLRSAIREEASKVRCHRHRRWDPRPRPEPWCRGHRRGGRFRSTSGPLRGRSSIELLTPPPPASKMRTINYHHRYPNRRLYRPRMRAIPPHLIVLRNRCAVPLPSAASSDRNRLALRRDAAQW